MNKTPELLEDISNKISIFPLFYDLSPKELEYIISKFKRNNYQPGETIFSENSTGDKFYVVLSGKVQTSKVVDGKEVILSYIDEGEGFGEIALLNKNQKRSATITAVKETSLMELSKKDFENLMKEYPKIKKGISKLKKQRVSLSENFLKEKGSLLAKRGWITPQIVLQDKGSLLKTKFETEEIPILELLFKLNEATGGKEQLEHCKETALLGKEMCNILCPYLCEEVQFAAYLHEVGKIALDEKIILKHRQGETLSEEELEKVKDYPNHTIKIISAIASLKDEIDFIKYFQEDNYRSMPLGAQILRVANDYQEMVHPSYFGLSEEVALEKIKEKSGTCYNPMVVIALEKTLEKVKSKNVKTQLIYLDIIKKALDSKDEYTCKHSMDTTRIALAIGKNLRLNKEDMKALEMAGELHDIGKIKIPESILNAPRKLEPWEFEVIKKHPGYSASFFDDIPGFERVSKIIKYHHEKYNGKGYPDGLSGEDIPYLSRVLAVADVFSALTTPRVYRRDEQGRKKAFTKEKALSIMKEMEGHFDPDIFEVFEKMIPEL